MSPEQARGEPADHRSDLFSFGVVLYEMLTGRRAFQRDTWAETLGAVLRDEPPASPEITEKIGPALERATSDTRPTSTW
jgi:serine/threonine-protein kinase